MSGSTSNLRNCLVISLQAKTVNYLNMLSIDFTATPQLNILNTNPECFEGEPTAAKALSNIQTLLGLTTIPPNLKPIFIEAYDLTA